MWVRETRVPEQNTSHHEFMVSFISKADIPPPKKIKASEKPW